jgi:hypothetical protein
MIRSRSTRWAWRVASTGEKNNAFRFWWGRTKKNYMDLVRERTIPAELVPTFADRGCNVVSVTDSYGRIRRKTTTEKWEVDARILHVILEKI